MNVCMCVWTLVCIHRLLILLSYNIFLSFQTVDIYVVLLYIHIVADNWFGSRWVCVNMKCVATELVSVFCS